MLANLPVITKSRLCLGLRFDRYSRENRWSMHWLFCLFEYQYQTTIVQIAVDHRLFQPVFSSYHFKFLYTNQYGGYH